MVVVVVMEAMDSVVAPFSDPTMTFPVRSTTSTFTIASSRRNI